MDRSAAALAVDGLTSEDIALLVSAQLTGRLHLEEQMYVVTDANGYIAKTSVFESVLYILRHGVLPWLRRD